MNPKPETSPVTLIRRYLECTGFVLLWMAIEFNFHLHPVTSQLIGIPLIAIFQIAVARRPLVQLWAFDAESFRLDRRTLLTAAGLALGCGALLWLGRGHAATPLNPRRSLFLLVLAATIPAAIGLRAQRRAELLHSLPWVVAAAIFRVGWHNVWQDGPLMFPAARLLDFTTLWLCEFVAFFIVDEVAFRGAIDPHLERASTGRLHAWCSAVFGSLLWAVWHLPAYNPHAKSFLALFAAISPFSIAIVVLGTLLSLGARQARTLVPTSVMHAFGNAYVLSLLK